MKKAARLWILLASFFWGAAVATSVLAEAFYEGKTISIVTSGSPGGGFDTFSRLLARHMGRHIPGKPRFIVQNMPGGGHMIAANTVYRKQPGDGLTIVNFHSGTISRAVLKDPAAKFDPKKYVWLGAPDTGLPKVFYVRTDLPIRSAEDWRKVEKPVHVGSTGPGSATYQGAEFLRLVGFPVQHVSGYPGMAQVTLALEGKEVDAVFVAQATMESVHRRLLDEGNVRPILSLGTAPPALKAKLDPLPGVATLDDIELSPQHRRFSKFLMASWDPTRLYALPPGTPADRVKILKQAFLEALKSPELLRQAEREGLLVTPVSADDVEQLVEILANAPQDDIELYKKILGL